MVRLEDAVIARIERFGEKFEVLVNPNLAMDLRKGKPVDFNELLATDIVYKSVSSGEAQAENLIKKAFETTDIKVIAKKIIEKGDVQLTSAQRKEFIEKKKKEIIEYIARNAINPQTDAPHTTQRLEIAFEELGIHVDPFKGRDEQLDGIISRLRTSLPIRIEKLSVAVKIPPTYSAKAVNVLHSFNVKKQEWQNDGSVILLFEIPAGLKMDLINKVNSLTQGEATIRFLENKKEV